MLMSEIEDICPFYYADNIFCLVDRLWSTHKPTRSIGSCSGQVFDTIFRLNFAAIIVSSGQTTICGIHATNGLETTRKAVIPKTPKLILLQSLRSTH